MAHPAAPDAPVWHLAPTSGWLNDPNGLTFAGGWWHAFYQHHPHGDQWGPMHWGHARSRDGLHWEHRPIALAPDELGTIFSGSVVHDLDGSAGFGAGALVACFTHHAETVQHQSIAWSVDGGDSWTKYGGNPVLPGSVPDFRDPKVCRLRDGRWHMVVTLRDHLEFFASNDLLHWEPLGVFAADVGRDIGVADVGAWECPDLLPLDDGRWMLVASLATGGPRGHSGGVCWIGSYEPGNFVPHGAAAVLDHGPDHYAFQSFSNAGPRHPVGMAWMSSWAYANAVPSAGRRGVLSLPRALRVDAAGVVRWWPAVQPAAFVDRGAHWVPADADVEVRIDGADGWVSAGVRDGVAFVERVGDRVAGYVGRDEVPVGAGPHLVVVDHGTVEVFAAGGTATLSAQVFAGPSPRVQVLGG